MKMMMNTVLAATLMGSIATAAVASNETVNQPVVNQAAFAQVTTVKQALGMKDDSNVQLKGYVVKAVGDEKYQFRDRDRKSTRLNSSHVKSSYAVFCLKKKNKKNNNK